jgi:D-xylose transport system substrate-binding protein
MSRGNAWPILIVAVALLAAVGSVAAGCGGGEEASGTIALLLPDEQSARYRTHDRPEFERKVSELCDGCKVLYNNAGGSAPRQKKQAEEAIAKGADVLVVDPVDVYEAAAIVQNAKVRDVPVIAYDRLFFNARIDYYVDVNSEAIGEVQAQALSEKLRELGKREGPLALITTNTSGPVNLGASLTFNSTGLQVAAAYHMPEAPEASVSLSEREMRRAISTLGPNGFGGVYAVDDKAATGVIEAMKSAGINPKSKVVTGSGATIPGLQRLLTGQQHMTVYEANEEEAATAAELAVELAKGEEVPPEKITDEPANGLRDVPAILLQPDPVTKANIKSTVIDNGFVDPAQLCAGRYVKYCREVGIDTK